MTSSPGSATALRTESDFALAGASHQFMYRITRRFIVMQDSVHLFRDRHLHAVGAGETDGRMRSKDTFRHHPMHSRHDLGQLASAAQFHADAAVTRQSAGAG